MDDLAVCYECNTPIYYCETCNIWHHEPWIDSDEGVLLVAKCVGAGGPFQTEDRWQELYGRRAVDGG